MVQAACIQRAAGRGPLPGQFPEIVLLPREAALPTRARVKVKKSRLTAVGYRGDEKEIVADLEPLYMPEQGLARPQVVLSNQRQAPALIAPTGIVLLAADMSVSEQEQGKQENAPPYCGTYQPLLRQWD